MSKCASRKAGRPSKLNNTANAGRIVRGRNGRKILPAFLLTFFRGTCHRRDTAGKERAPKSLRRRSGKRSFVKAVGTIRQENRQGRGKLPPLYAAVRVRCRSYGVSRIPDPSPGGSQGTGGAFRSRVQRPGVRGCSHEQRSKTYLGGVKPRTAHIYKSDIRLHILPAL